MSPKHVTLGWSKKWLSLCSQNLGKKAKFYYEQRDYYYHKHWQPPFLRHIAGLKMTLLNYVLLPL